MPKTIIMLIGCCLSFLVLAADAPFWLSVEQGRGLIPQPAAKTVVTDSDTTKQQAASNHFERLPPEATTRRDLLTFFPCSQCHDHWKTDPEPRQLAPVHAVGLQHGQSHLWCLVCHDADDRDRLRTIRGEPVDFNESWRVCGQCHSTREKDWYFGAHGKRVYDWQGEAKRYNCTHCHNPHRPHFARRKPQPKPGVRQGLQPMKLQVHNERPVWEQKPARSAQEGDHE